LYLGWLIRNDLVDPRFFATQDLLAIKAGSMTGSDLGDFASTFSDADAY